MTTWIYILLGVLLISIIYLINYILNANRKIDDRVENIIRHRKNNHRNKYTKSQGQLVDLMYKEWLSQNEFEIRRTAIIEMNPIMQELISNEIEIIKNNFAFNPKDIKFIGRFVDLIIFDGVADEESVNIYFVNIVKEDQNRPFLNKEKVRNSVKNKLVFFHEINL
jgi:predicted Holliday junction resolvase-like endonuclease